MTGTGRRLTLQFLGPVEMFSSNLMNIKCPSAQSYQAFQIKNILFLIHLSKLSVWESKSHVNSIWEARTLGSE